MDKVWVLYGQWGDNNTETEHRKAFPREIIKVWTENPTDEEILKAFLGTVSIFWKSEMHSLSVLGDQMLQQKIVSSSLRTCFQLRRGRTWHNRDGFYVWFREAEMSLIAEEPRFKKEEGCFECL
jgi:hypothetical protein